VSSSPTATVRIPADAPHTLRALAEQAAAHGWTVDASATDTGWHARLCTMTGGLTPVVWEVLARWTGNPGKFVRADSSIRRSRGQDQQVRSASLAQIRAAVDQVANGYPIRAGAPVLDGFTTTQWAVLADLVHAQKAAERAHEIEDLRWDLGFGHRQTPSDLYPWKEAAWAELRPLYTRAWTIAKRAERAASQARAERWNDEDGLPCDIRYARDCAGRALALAGAVAPLVDQARALVRRHEAAWLASVVTVAVQRELDTAASAEPERASADLAAPAERVAALTMDAEREFRTWRSENFRLPESDTEAWDRFVDDQGVGEQARSLALQHAQDAQVFIVLSLGAAATEDHRWQRPVPAEAVAGTAETGLAALRKGARAHAQQIARRVHTFLSDEAGIEALAKQWSASPYCGTDADALRRLALAAEHLTRQP
jgi:hypothetical protein